MCINRKLRALMFRYRNSTVLVIKMNKLLDESKSMVHFLSPCHENFTVNLCKTD